MGYSNIDCEGTRFCQKKIDRKGDGEKWMEGRRRKGCIMACVFGFWHCFCLSIWAGRDLIWEKDGEARKERGSALGLCFV